MYEEKLKTMEEERSDALEVAAQAYEEREAATLEEVVLLDFFSILS